MSQRLTLTIPEAAELLGISRNLAYELAQRDELPVPVLRLGRRLLVSRPALERALGVNGEAPAREWGEGQNDPGGDRGRSG